MPSSTKVRGPSYVPPLSHLLLPSLPYPQYLPPHPTDPSLDKDRIQKSLRSSHPNGKVPVLRAFSSEQAEAAFIATEIKRVVANMGGVFKWCDFVVLREWFFLMF